MKTIEKEALRMLVLAVLFSCALILSACNEEPTAEPQQNQQTINHGEEGGAEQNFKVPVAPGYDWEITQSWAEHCQECDKKYPNPNDLYCKSSHMASCCRFGWDFNLPRNADEGKPVLASADGYVESTQKGYNGGWGNTVIINHGNNICTRYSHMLDGSITVAKNDYVCQGLKIGEIGTTGNSQGYHLHFQFETCTTHQVQRMQFTDGNEVPKCMLGDDRYDDEGNYVGLKLTNSVRENCDDNSQSSEDWQYAGWVSAACGALDHCPLVPNCGRGQHHQFNDEKNMSDTVRNSAMYLWGECAVDGKSDGGFHPNDYLTRAEALKIPMYLFGLMRECGSTEPFADVDADDWFYTVVTCGVSHEIIKENSYFNPNQEANFAEAAKLIVLSAMRSNLIELKTPDTAHFPFIGKDHWAYSYVETLYFYGGLIRNPSAYRPTDKVKRGDFALMVAALSPCYCGNVECNNGCTCDQMTFACVDPNDDTSGTGGQGDYDNSGEDPSETGAGDNFASGDPSKWEDQLDLQCSGNEELTTCENNGVLLYIQCSMANNGSEQLRINNLVMSLANSASRRYCEVTDANLRSGLSTQNIDSGETKDLSGHFEVLCSQMPENGILQGSFGLLEKISGEEFWYPNLLTTTTSVDSASFDSCESTNTNSGQSDGDSGEPSSGEPASGTSQTCFDPTPSCWQNWECIIDPIYYIKVFAPGSGRVTVLFEKPNRVKSSYDLVQESNFSDFIAIECQELPVVIMFENGTQAGSISTMKATSHPPLAFWLNYGDTFPTIPPESPSVVDYSLKLEPRQTVFVRVPFEY